MEKKWWKEEVIYQIYPRSFMDGNGDGIGDLQGIRSKLDHLEELGVDIIWLSPIYQSPNDDNGYDISDYYDIHPEFGTMEEFDELLNDIHARGMKLIMDLVVNHTSDEHQWFEESRKSINDAKRDYYIWKPGKNGGPPNNWRSFFGGSAWELDEKTGEYYLHLFTKKQPDLNWENPKVREEINEVLRFWLEKGIDGFRMDVIPLISKRLEFADAPQPSFNEVVAEVYSNGPKVHEYINGMYESVIKHYDVMTVGEGPGITKEVGLNYVGHDRGELNMIFHLDHMFLGHGPKGKFDPVNYGWPEIKKIFKDWDEAMGDSGWISIFLDNHDFPRLVSRFGNDQEHREASAKLLAVLILTHRGTPCIYQGTEIGMSNVKFNDINQYKDVETLNFYTEFTEAGTDPKKFIELVHEHGRDNVRTPIHWTDGKNAGFSEGTPWIEVNPNYKEINLTEVKSRKDSIFYFYKEFLKFRKEQPVLIYGSFDVIEEPSENLYVYKRVLDAEEMLIILNHSDEHSPLAFNLDGYSKIQNNMENTMEKVLLPWEARIYKRINS